MGGAADSAGTVRPLRPLPGRAGFERDGAGWLSSSATVDGVRSPALAARRWSAPRSCWSRGRRCGLPLAPSFEYGAVAMTGTAEVAGAELKPGVLLYLDRGRDDLTLSSVDGAPAVPARRRAVRRTTGDVVELRRAHARGDRRGAGRLGARQGGRRRRFGTVTGYAGDPLPAPDLPTVRLKARGRDGTVRG
jgi:hypothetical protein